MKAHPEKKGEVAERGARWFARKADVPDLPGFIDRVVLAHNLTEVRAQFAFTRLDSPTPDAEGEVELSAVHPAPLADHSHEDYRWLPAVKIFGEGIFIAFDIDAVRAWEALDAVKAHEQKFKDAFKTYNRKQSSQARIVSFPGARLLMLHTLAHLLIQAIGLEAGYPATALKERIYCYRGDNPQRRSRGHPDLHGHARHRRHPGRADRRRPRHHQPPQAGLRAGDVVQQRSGLRATRARDHRRGSPAPRRRLPRLPPDQRAILRADEP